ncbi:ABC transporter ATP-binding protein [Paracoccus methylovorus]|uniref:ABC transporter ATP-binding protein n=1 Tax=Paracoccus methylovorus TaxID=2812658 RepID=A0ABX7JLT5_9RHOB|nr:ABC transporter ATP-binding protein [Paracoccus methylovorus]QRZ15221.1 ABC transporter ATP-binding protein [Paracoccus methylovorus]
MSRVVISTQGLGFDRDRRVVLSDVELAIRAAEIVAILGANGAGKSTLLRLMLKLLRPARGSVSLYGMPLAAMRRRDIAAAVAYVPQHHTPPFPYTVAQVAGLGRLVTSGLLKLPGARDEKRVQAVLERLGIAHLAQRDYTGISGGERQLVLIARALVQGARILLMDEPDVGLDYGNQRRLLDLMRALAAEGHTIVFTTHHPDHTLYAADRAVLIDGGKILADGGPASVLTPQVIHAVYGVRVARVGHGPHIIFVPA